MNSTWSSTENATSTDTVCEPSTDYHLYNQISLAPAVVIIIILMFMKRRAVRRLDCCDGRPGIQPPIDTLGSEENRLSYANAYAAMAVAVTILFFNKVSGKPGQVVVLPGPRWVAVFDGIVTIILLGVIFLPMFLTLSTPSKLLGSIMGFAYTSMRLAFLFVVALRCPLDKLSVFPPYPIMMDLPTILAHVFLIVRYAVIFVKEVKGACRRRSTTKSELLMGKEQEFKINPHFEAHVRTLLQGKTEGDEVRRKWYKKGRDFVYTPNPDFKYSVNLLSTVIVAGIIIYEISIMILGMAVGQIVEIRDQIVGGKELVILAQGAEAYMGYVRILDIAIGTLVAATITSALYMYFQMYRMMVAHRFHVIKLMKGNRHFLPRNLGTPDNLVGQSLRYCGYQIAHFIWGYLIMLVILGAVVLAISLAITVLPAILTPKFKSLLLSLFLGLLPTICLAIFIWVFQKLLAVLVFKDRTMESKVVNIDNRRCYLLISFFFFFFNILVGLVSCFLRILKGMILGILFIGRIDRPLLMKGFTSMDTAYMAYIGFLHLQVAHKHPVVLVYCHMLWEKSRHRRNRRATAKFTLLDETISETTPNEQELTAIGPKPAYPRVSPWALNKWFVAVTIIHNPSLILNRKGFLKHILIGLGNSHAAKSVTEVALPDASQKDPEIRSQEEGLVMLTNKTTEQRSSQEEGLAMLADKTTAQRDEKQLRSEIVIV